MMIYAERYYAMKILDHKHFGGRSLSFLLFVCCLGLCGCTPKSQDFEIRMTSDAQAPESSFDIAGQMEQAQDGKADGTGPSGNAAEADAKDPQSEMCWVHICGAVKRPSVYELPRGSRIVDAVQAAGGFLENADNNYVNLAEPVRDGMKVVIPTLAQTGEEEAQAFGIVSEGGALNTDEKESTRANNGTEGTSSDGKIDLNKADRDLLCTLTGIGGTKADAIIAYRDACGGFSSPEELMQVNGIGEGTYQKIRDRITVNP